MPALRVIRASAHVVVPWKNGGGAATAIVAQPEGAGFDAFDWRLSGARVAQDGPFSIFPHIDRTMLILRGPSITLHGVPGAPRTLTPASPPFEFAGDLAVHAVVPAGPIDNLNLMVDRRRFASATRRIDIADVLTLAPPRGVVLVYCEVGSFRADAVPLDEHDTLVADRAVALSGEGRAIVMEIWPTELGPTTA